MKQDKHITYDTVFRDIKAALGIDITCIRLLLAFIYDTVLRNSTNGGLII